MLLDKLQVGDLLIDASEWAHSQLVLSHIIVETEDINVITFECYLTMLNLQTRKVHEFKYYSGGEVSEIYTVIRRGQMLREFTV